MKRIRTLVVDHEALARQQELLRKNVDELSERISALLKALTSTRPMERLKIKSDGRVFLLKVEQIDWVDAQGCYVRVHSAGKPHLVRCALGQLESRLDPGRFVRIHRSTLVNIDRIKELLPQFHGEYLVVMQDGSRLKLSRGFRKSFDRLL